MILLTSSASTSLRRVESLRDKETISGGLTPIWDKSSEGGEEGEEGDECASLIAATIEHDGP